MRARRDGAGGVAGATTAVAPKRGAANWPHGAGEHAGGYLGPLGAVDRGRVHNLQGPVPSRPRPDTSGRTTWASSGRAGAPAAVDRNGVAGPAGEGGGNRVPLILMGHSVGSHVRPGLVTEHSEADRRPGAVGTAGPGQTAGGRDEQRLRRVPRNATEWLSRDGAEATPQSATPWRHPVQAGQRRSFGPPCGERQADAGDPGEGEARPASSMCSWATRIRSTRSGALTPPNRGLRAPAGS